MADEASHVLRVPRSDDEGSFILARVSSSGPASRPLNARVVATEGVAPYVLKLRHDRIDKLRGQNAPCSPDEWERILAFLLLGQGSFDNVDATATVQEESTLTITVRKRVQNITQRLGTLSLAYDGDEGIELFEWCGEAIDGRARVERELAAAAAQQSTLQSAVDDLKAQLDEFLAAKDADETALLEKFCTLLNEKKVKIRLQQRQLAKAAAEEEEEGSESAKRAAAKAEIKEDEDEEEEAVPSRAPARGKRAPRGRLGKVGTGAGPARRGAKRRAAAVSDEESDSDDDAFDKPSGAAAAAAAATAESGTHSEEEDDRTTENDDESTESEPEPEAMEEDVDIKEEERSQRPRAAKAAQAEKTQAQPEPPAEPEAPPPRRTLAFGKAKAAAPAPAVVASSSKDQDMDGSDTESDDEL